MTNCPNCGSNRRHLKKGELDLYVCESCGTEFFDSSPDMSAQTVTPKTLYERGCIELRNKQFAEAAKSFDRAIDRSPDFSKAYFARCLAKNHCIDRADIYGSRVILSVVSYLSDDGTYEGKVDDNTARNAYLKVIGQDFKTAADLASDEVDKNIYNGILEKAVPLIVNEFLSRKYDLAASKQSSGR